MDGWGNNGISLLFTHQFRVVLSQNIEHTTEELYKGRRSGGVTLVMMSA
jgi:hypothetical protein